MTTTNRTDVHSPANLVTEDYEYVFCLDNQAPWAVSLDNDFLREITSGLRRSPLADRWTSQSHHCGARLRYVGLLRHLPTGAIIAVGETCLDNRFERATADFHRVRKAAELDRQAQRIKTAAREFFAALPEGDIRTALDRDTDLTVFPGLDAYALNTIADIRRKLWDVYGEISERQAAFIGRLIEQGAQRAVRQAEIEAEVNVPAPRGRVTFEGVVVSRKYKENDFGGAWKLTVKVTETDGVWLAWVTEPSSIETERGDVIRLTATLEPSDNAHFAFGKRPSKAEIIGRVAVEASALD